MTPEVLALDLADAVREQTLNTGAATPAIRGGDWRMATVATVGADGTVTTTDGIPVRRMETYISPTAGDLIYLTQSGSGDWLAWGRSSTGGVAIGETAPARKPVSTSRASTTTMAADPHLTLTLSPGTYKLDAFLMYDGNPAADLKLGWSAPAGTTGAWWPGGPDSSMTALAWEPRWGVVSDVGTSTLPVGAQGAGVIVACRPVGTVVITTAGSFALMWAQQTSSATPTVLRGQSTLELKRIA